GPASRRDGAGRAPGAALMPLARSQGWSYVIRHGGREIPVSDGDVVLGRSHSAGIRVDEETVSRSHALLTLREGRAVIRDLGSSNGLFVAGRRVAGQAAVSDGDTIGLGSAVLTFSVIPPPDLEARTAMIGTLPGGVGRPTETVTRFIPVEAPASPPAEPVRKRRPRSLEDFEIGGGGDEAPPMEARIEAFDPASVGSRIASAVVDLLLSAAIAFVCFVPALIAIVTHGSLRERVGSGLAFRALVGFCGVAGLAAVIVYYLSGWCGRGATVGQRSAQVRLVAEEGGFVPGGRAFLRFLVLLLYFATAGLLALTVVFDPEHRGLADKVSKSRVVAG
ncbi:MAG TPA: FHA domain-containing protein, partial [Thermoanaerobaculia bacterium]|nr:FHA domain-containing protein [Thermoanaerobaculia bacterium]